MLLIEFREKDNSQCSVMSLGCATTFCYQASNEPTDQPADRTAIRLGSHLTVSFFIAAGAVNEPDKEIGRQEQGKFHTPQLDAHPSSFSLAACCELDFAEALFIETG